MQPCHKGCVLMIIKECPKIATCLSVYLSKDSGFFVFNDVCVSTEKYKLIECNFFFIPKKAIFLVSPLLLSHSIISMMMWSLWCLSLVIWDFLSWQSSFSILIMMVACYNAELIVLSMILVWNGIASYQFSISH